MYDWFLIYIIVALYDGQSHLEGQSIAYLFPKINFVRQSPKCNIHDEYLMIASHSWWQSYLFQKEGG